MNRTNYHASQMEANITLNMRKIEEKSNSFIAIVRINVVKKEFIIDTGSPINIMPLDERIETRPKYKKY